MPWLQAAAKRDMPPQVGKEPQSTHRLSTIDGSELDFTEGFADLHTCVYEGILAGRGCGLENAQSSIELVHRIRSEEQQTVEERLHLLVGHFRKESVA